MSDIQVTEGQMTLRGARIALLVSRFNSFVVESLLEGAIDTLKRHGAEDNELQIVRVPGAYEMPVAAQRLAATKRYEAIIALGAVANLPLLALSLIAAIMNLETLRRVIVARDHRAPA